MEEETKILSLDDFCNTENRTPTKHRESYYFKIDEYTLEGNYIRTWNSSSEAAAAYGISGHVVCRCARGEPLYVEKVGRIFLKENDSIKERLKRIDSFSVTPGHKASRITVKEYDLKGHLIMVYPSIVRAASHCSNNVEIVKKVLNGKWLYTKDERIFLREGDSVESRLELIRQRNYNDNMDRSIDMYSLKGTPSGHFRNAVEAAERFKINVLLILDCCLGVVDRCKANIFLFSGDSVKERLKLIKKNKKDV